MKMQVQFKRNYKGLFQSSFFVQLTKSIFVK